VSIEFTVVVLARIPTAALIRLSFSLFDEQGCDLERQCMHVAVSLNFNSPLEQIMIIISGRD